MSDFSKVAVNGITYNVKDAAVREALVTPEMFGAVGDGVTDDTDAIKNCFAKGSPVFISGTYKIDETLTYSGPLITGTGKFVVSALPSGSAAVLNINSDDCIVDSIEIDGNAKACLLIYATVTNSITVKHCILHNTNTSYYGSNYSSSGVIVSSSKTAEIAHNKIYDINRSNGVELTHSSTGIAVYSNNTIYVHDNEINNVKSTTGYFDCDGIYVAQNNDSYPVVATVENNKIYNCTGRFIKSQTKYTVARNNYCVLETSFVPNDKYFNCVSIQRGSFEIVNNYFDLKDCFDRGYTKCFSLEIYDTSPRTGIIKGNTVIGSHNSRMIRNYFSYVTTVEGASINIDISNNQFLAPCEGLIGFGTDYDIAGFISVLYNKLNVYQVFDISNSSFKSLGSLCADIRFNDDSLYNSITRLSDPTMVFTRLKYRYNVSLNESINNYPIDYNDLAIFEGYYRGANQQMLNVPSAIARGDYLYMNKSPMVCEYYNDANRNRGYIIS